MGGFTFTPYNSTNDFPNTMGWSDAKKACSNLGEGWRLPTKSELKFLFLYKDVHAKW
mgnify:CR=1 FL=1